MDNAPLQPVEFDFREDSEALYIFFGGIAAGITLPVFEFYNASRIIDQNKLFIRDLYQCWYQAGIHGISTDINTTSSFLQEVRDRLHPARTVLAGNSMGGFAAILFGRLLGECDVVAFAPQTFISPELRKQHNDTRWARRIHNTYIRSRSISHVWDLKDSLTTLDRNPSITVFVSPEEPLDYIHANHIRDIPGVRIHEFRHGGHGIVKLLRDRGQLPAIMDGTYVHRSGSGD